MRSSDKRAATDRAVGLLKKVGALRYGTIPLSSGKTSDYYFDSKELTLDPEGAAFVAEQLTKKLRDLGVEFVGGTPYSGIPIVAHICQSAKQPQANQSQRSTFGREKKVMA